MSDDWNPTPNKLITKFIQADDQFFLNNLQQENYLPALYDPIKDIKHEKWANNTYGKISNILSCPSCFTSISYDSTAQGSTYISKSTFYTKIGENIHKSGNETFLSVTCEHCSCTLGVFDPLTHTFHLFHVLPPNINV